MTSTWPTRITLSVSPLARLELLDGHVEPRRDGAQRVARLHLVARRVGRRRRGGRASADGAAAGATESAACDGEAGAAGDGVVRRLVAAAAGSWSRGGRCRHGGSARGRPGGPRPDDGGVVRAITRTRNARTISPTSIAWPPARPACPGRTPMPRASGFQGQDGAARRRPEAALVATCRQRLAGTRSSASAAMKVAQARARPRGTARAAWLTASAAGGHRRTAPVVARRLDAPPAAVVRDEVRAHLRARAVVRLIRAAPAAWRRPGPQRARWPAAGSSRVAVICARIPSAVQSAPAAVGSGAAPCSAGSPPALRLKCNNPGDDLFSRKAALSVSSALESLTSVFGMGTGVASPLESPGLYASGR